MQAKPPLPRVAGRLGSTRIAIAAAVGDDIDQMAGELIRDTESIRRTLPDVAADVLLLCQHPDSNADKIEKAVTRDPFISAQLISMSNSAMFAPRMPIVGVRDAIVRVGLDTVRDIVMMVVTSSTMYRLPGFEAAVEMSRKRSMATAFAARLMAKALRVQADYAFLAGLLHDIGDLVLLERCVKAGVLTPAMTADRELAPVIKERLLRHHTEVGAAVCRTWKLPQGVIDSAAYHHQYRTGDKHYIAANLVAASDLMADHVGLSTTPRTVDPADPVFADVGLSPEKVTACLAELQTALPTIEAR